MGTSKDPIYVTEDAAKVVKDNISSSLQSKVSLNQIESILELEVEFFKSKNLVKDAKPENEEEESTSIDMNELTNFLLNNQTKSGLKLSHNEIKEILTGEEIYMRQIGIID